jgi:hypothetical protein
MIARQALRLAFAACRLLIVLSVSYPSTVSAGLLPCTDDGRAMTAALVRLRESVDPCGESADILAVLDKVERCTGNLYSVCPDPQATRNVFDRPTESTRVITWNPQLRSEVELQCSANRAEPLLRDPTASLLHELVHAAQDCDGLNPGEYELEAVRIENIYRRAVGLCQRGGYGEDRLPSSMVMLCPTRPCSCSTPPGEEIEHGPDAADDQLVLSSAPAVR